jgi:hypothetical protein
MRSALMLAQVRRSGVTTISKSFERTRARRSASRDSIARAACRILCGRGACRNPARLHYGGYTFGFDVALDLLRKLLAIRKGATAAGCGQFLYNSNHQCY